jgi:cell division protein FtsB
MMSLWRKIKRFGQDAIMPCVFAALAGYFVWGSWQGDRGLEAKQARQNTLLAAKQDLAAAQQEQAVWQRRVEALRTQNLDRDALDERVRDRLNLANPADVVVMYPPGQRVF